MQQSRFDLAEQELRRALLDDPNNPQAHALLAVCLSRREQFVDATAEAQTAIGLAPDWAYSHYCLARVMLARNRLAEADASARETVQLEPENADYWGLLASVHMSQRRWKDALVAAEEGLSHDAEHAECANLRTMALAQLGRGADATQLVDETLAKHPDNAYSHAAKGWALLQQNKPQKALEHFRESLRIDPTLEFARMGMIEALKAHNPIYRVMLGYFLWMGRLDSRVQWGVILGGYFGAKILRGAAKANPALFPWVLPILILYLAFVLLTWFADPLFNLLLRFNRYGRYALSRDQRAASQLFAGCMLTFLVAALVGLAAGVELAYFVAGFAVIMALPLVTIFKCDVGWPRSAMTGFSGLMALAGLGAIVGIALDQEWAVGLASAFMLGFVATPWLANYLMMQTVRR